MSTVTPLPRRLSGTTLNQELDDVRDLIQKCQAISQVAQDAQDKPEAVRLALCAIDDLLGTADEKISASMEDLT